jgi:cytochrome c
MMRGRALLLVALAGLAVLAACGRTPGSEPMTGGNPRNGRELIVHFGCGTCHQIPGVERADGRVGPPLAGLRERLYIGGVASNTPEHLVHWIQHPRELSPKTVMPDLGVKDAEARDIAAYLYSR